MDLFTLSAKLTVDSGAFTKGLNDAEKAGSNLSSKLDKITSVAKKVAGALVFKKAISSLKSLADKAGQAGDKIDKASQKVGLSRTAYQEWAYILDKCGGNIDSLGTALKTMNNKIETGSDAVGKLGLKFEDLQKMSIEDRFNAVVKALQDMPDGAEKSALALELFGKQGQELMPLLNSSAEEVEALRQRFHDLGIELTDEQINAAAKYQDTLSDLMQVFDGIKILIGSELLPVVTEWADKMAMYAGKLLKAYKEDGGLSGVFKVLKEDISTLTETLKSSGNPVLEALGAIIDGIWSGLQIAIGLFTDFEGTVQSMKESDSLGVQMLGSAIEAVGTALDWIVKNENIVVPAIGAIIAAFAVGKIAAFLAALNPISVALTLIATAAYLVAANWESVKEKIIGIWNSIKEAVSNAWDAVTKWFEDRKSDISNAWSAVGQWFKTTVWEPIKESATAAWDSVKKWWENKKSAISNAWSTIAGWFKTTVWEPLKEAASSAWEAAEKWWQNKKSDISNAWSTVATWFKETVWSPLTEAITNAWTAVSKWWENKKSSISDAWSTVASWFKDTVWSPIQEAVSSAWNSVTKWWETNVTNNLKKVWEGVVGVFQPVIDVVGSLIDKLAALFGYDKKSMETFSKHTHTETTIIEEIRKGLPKIGGTDEKEPAFPENLPTAKGSWDVPYDNYPALLHRNEMVLTSSQARKLRDNGSLGSGTGSLGDLAAMIVDAIKEGMANAQVNSYLDGKRLTDEVSRIMGGDITSRRFA